MMRLFKSGIATAITMFLTITMHSHECRATSNLTYDPISCANTAGLDPDTAAFVNLQCSLKSQLFPTSSDATVIYQVESEIQQAESYNLTGVAGQAGKIQVVWCLPQVPVDNTSETKPFVQDIRVSAVVGHIVGDNDASVPVSCVSWSYASATTGVRFTGLVVTAQITESELNSYALQTRLDAGERIVDSATGVSYTVNSQLPGPISSAMANPSDISTIYCSFDAVPGAQDLPAQTFLGCIKDKGDTYQNNLKSCRQGLGYAMAAAMAAWTATMATCALFLITGPFGVLAMASCVAIAFALFAAIMALAAAQFGSCKGQAYNQLKIDLRSCGVYIYEA